MKGVFLSLLKKDFRMVISSKFLLFGLGSLILYSLYIQLIYVNIDQAMYSVYVFDPENRVENTSEHLIFLESYEELQKKILDRYAVGIDATEIQPKIIMTESGIKTTDYTRAIYGLSILSSTYDTGTVAEVIGENTREMKRRREMTSEFLFFELVAVGFLGLAATLFKEKQMGVIRIHGIMPISKKVFVLSKLVIFLSIDLIFATALTFINLGVDIGAVVLPGILVHTLILSLIMALLGLSCALWIGDFRQFSLLYFVFVVFMTTPIFLVVQTGVEWHWVKYHPMYYVFSAIKSAYFGQSLQSLFYYLVSSAWIVGLFFLASQCVGQEMVKEG